MVTRYTNLHYLDLRTKAALQGAALQKYLKVILHLNEGNLCLKYSVFNILFIVIVLTLNMTACSLCIHELGLSIFGVKGAIFRVTLLH